MSHQSSASTVDDSFPTTRWTIVRLAARDDGEQARGALESLCRDYRKPLLAFLRAAFPQENDAEDTIQDFLAEFVTKGGFAKAEQPKGRLRSFLRKSLQNFAIGEWRKRRSESRGGILPAIPYWEASETNEGARPAATPDPGTAAYDCEWAKTVMGMALARLQKSYEERGKGKLFGELENLIDLETLSPAARAEIASRVGIEAKRLSVERTRFQRRLRKALEEIVSHTVETREEIKEEMRYLLSALAVAERTSRDGARARGRGQADFDRNGL